MNPIPQTVAELVAENWSYVGPRYVVHEGGERVLEAQGSDRARLAAQAPAMARMLLELYEGRVTVLDQEDRERAAIILRAAGLLP